MLTYWKYNALPEERKNRKQCADRVLTLLSGNMWGVRRLACLLRLQTYLKG